MRSWFYRHPNVAIALLVIALLVVNRPLWGYVEDDRWGMAAATFATGVFIIHYIRYWWDRT